MMLVNTLRRCIPVSVFSVLAALPGCGGNGSGVPAVTLRSAEGANDRSITYSPDGKEVAYWSLGAGGWDLMVSPADLSVATTVDSATLLGNPPIWSPDGSSLAYLAGADFDIWLSAADGSRHQQLTASKGVEIPLQWHPDGDRLTYFATGQGGSIRAYVVTIAAGTETRMLAEQRPAVGFWSPDGTKIAYMVIDGGKATIWLADSTGAEGRQLTTEGFEALSPQDPWSPDGSEVLFQSSRTGTTDIWVVPVDGDSARQLTRDVRNDFNARWSPDGRWVLFQSERGRQSDVWIVPAAGGMPRRVTDDEAVESDVQWVPGSTQIAFTTGVTQRGLWSHSLADGSEHRITPDSIRVGGYDLSPDRTEVVYQVVRGGGVSDLQVAPVDGGTPRILVAGSAENAAPRWSPDGTKVLFMSNRAGNDDVWVVDATGGEPTRLTDWPTDELDAAWSTNGDSVYFTSPHDASPLFDLWEVSASGGEPQRVTHVGTLQPGITVSPTTSDVLVRTVGGTEGQLGVGRVLADGTLEPVWDQSSVPGGMGQRNLAPSGDSVAILTSAADGGVHTMLLPVRGDAGRRILGVNEGVMEWSPDGTRLLYWSGLPNSDLYVMSLAGGTTQQVTDTPDDEGGAGWLADGQSVMFYRSTTHQRIATVDVGGLMAGGN